MPMLHANFAQPTLATDMLLLTSCGGPSMCPDRGRRRAMSTERAKQMASKVSDLLVLTTSPCVATGEVVCFGCHLLVWHDIPNTDVYG